MPLIITMGMGDPGSGGVSTLVTTSGYGMPGRSLCAAFLLTNLLALDDSLVLTFSDSFSASGPAARADGYSISLVGAGDLVQVLGLSLNGAASQLTLQTTLHTFGASYTLHMPEVGLLAFDSRPFNGPFDVNYLGGSGAPVIVQLARSLDARTIEIIFSRRVNRTDAENVLNYAISPSLTVSKSTRVTDFHYRLTTSQQVIDLSYDVTISNIRGA